MSTLTTYSSPLGTLVLEHEGDALVGLRFCDTEPAEPLPLATRASCPAVRWLDAYFNGHLPPAPPPLLLRGTAFQKKVWQEVLAIPYGQTISYAELAQRVGCRSARAVGGAVGRNPVAIIVPCHRVVGSDGSLTGYAYGIERKQALLRLELASDPQA